MKKKKNKKPLVSVIMPVYNAGDFLVEAINSVIKQEGVDFELICVDDGSVDGSWEILRKYEEMYPDLVRAFRLERNQGEGYVANLAFAKSRGKYIARMDADDVMVEGRLRRQVEFLEKNGDYVAVGGQALVINNSGEVIGEKRVPLKWGEIYEFLGKFNPMIHPTVMFRKDLIKSKTLYRVNYDGVVDYDTYFRLIQWGKMANLDEVLVLYRLHGENKSFVGLKSKFWEDVKIRLLAVARGEYRLSWMMLVTILWQSLVVLLMPERILLELFLVVRGLKKNWWLRMVREWWSGLVVSRARYQVS